MASCRDGWVHEVELDVRPGAFANPPVSPPFLRYALIITAVDAGVPQRDVQETPSTKWRTFPGHADVC
jgi:hypothetical protein